MRIREHWLLTTFLVMTSSNAFTADQPNIVLIVADDLGWNYPQDISCNANMQQPGHLYACKAAVMARCAGAQDRFWEMHDAIFALPELSVIALDALPDDRAVGRGVRDVRRK